MSDIDVFDGEAPEEDDEPDFAAVYEPHVDGDGWQMTPRMAWRLWTSAVYLADDWRYTRPSGPLDALPPIARPYFRERSWRQQFISSFERIAERIAGIDGDGDGDGDCLARCTAEELAPHFTINLAEDDFINDAISPAGVGHLPSHGAQDEDFNWMREVLFEDHDVLMLFNPALDGVENSCDGNASLRPRDWFRPFRPAAAT